MFLPDDGSNTLTYNTHTPHTVQITTFRMRSHLLLEKNGEGNKRKSKDYYGVANGEKKRKRQLE